jgi:predicted CXXCH cytochrome family protein
MKTNQKTKEVIKMRKIIMAVLLAFLSVTLVSVSAYAAISGTCSDCHTMHNSQDGAAVDSSGTNDNLTKFDCIGCHSGNIAAAPNVTGEGATMTAGGTFKSSIVGSTSSRTHNVRDISWTVDEVALLNTTPGSVAGGFTEPAGATELTCAGTTGCHGQATGGFSGFHHNAYPNAYRFLRINDGASYTDVNGVGSADWEVGGATTTNHNIYDGDGTNSISTFCAMCHGGFHGGSNTASSSPFQRHPTDEEALIDNVDGAGITITSATINETPFGFTSAQIALGMVTTDVTTGSAYTAPNGLVTCLSCHRAHGSAQSDLLRFDYSTMNAGNSVDNGGCETCHTAQR